MRKYFMLMLAAAGLLTGAAASASAATVTVSPGGAVAGTAGTSAFYLNTARRTIVCTGTTYAATYIAGTFGGVTLPYTLSTNLDMRFTGCRVGVNATVTCTATARIDATGLTAGVDGVTPLRISAISCTVFLTSTTCRIVIAGAVTGSHNNRAAILTVNATGQTLAATGSTCATLPNDPSVTFANTTGGLVTYAESPAQTITVT